MTNRQLTTALATAAESCCDEELRDLLLAAAGKIASIPRNAKLCAGCHKVIALVGDGWTRRGLCQKCYENERQRRKRAESAEPWAWSGKVAAAGVCQ